MKSFLKLLRQIALIVIFMVIAILLSQVLLYDYASNDKVVAQAPKYEQKAEIKETLSSQDEDLNISDVIEFTDDEISSGEYEVTNSDLNNYERTNQYNPGKVNPFSAYQVQAPSNNTGDGTDSQDAQNNSSNGNTNSNDGSTSQNGSTTTKRPGLTK